jgi:uncharacterized protein (TIGR04255 family)
LTATPLPHRLKNPTVEEAVFEVRFTPLVDSVVGILPGFLFSRLSKQYSKHETLPLASLPPALRAQTPELRYTQQIRLLSEDVFSLFVGDCVVGVSAVEPYPGWEAFRPRILEVATVLRESGMIKVVERISFKYVNILPLAKGEQLRGLNVSVTVSGDPVPEEGFRMRTEHNDRKYTRIIEIVTNASVERRSGERSEGLLVSQDAITPLPAASGADNLRSDLVEAVHEEAKGMFFRLITPETLTSLGPEYEPRS